VFDLKSVLVRFVVSEVSLAHVSLPQIPISPVSIIPLTLHAHLHLHVALSRSKNRRNLRSFHQKYFSQNREEVAEELAYFHLVLKE
jgi:hypothetical protein